MTSAPRWREILLEILEKKDNNDYDDVKSVIEVPKEPPPDLFENLRQSRVYLSR
jgi:hypothetical protein